MKATRAAAAALVSFCAAQTAASCECNMIDSELLQY